MNIRPFQPADIASLRRICLLTGLRGQSAEHLYSDADLLGDFYAAPYATFHPELTWVLVNERDVSGYVLGTPDTAAFGLRCETEWFPAIRRRITTPSDEDQSADARLIRLVMRGHEQINRQADYPAHLHIDILPEAQSGGWGRRLMEALLRSLAAAEVPGVHLVVNRQNVKAVGFYEHLGFQLIQQDELTKTFGYKLSKKK